MPTSTTNVGGMTLPVPAGAQNSAIDDPVVSGIATYLQLWLRDSLNTKLANIQGAGSDACPYVFLWDPAQYFARGDDDGTDAPFPALYVYWDGRSKRADVQTMLYDIREREISVCYIYEELQYPGGANTRRGILPAVDATFFKAGERWRHPSYSSNDWILSKLNLNDFRYLGGVLGELKASVPEASRASGSVSEGAAVRGFPALSAKFRVRELIQLDQPTDDDDLGDTTFVISGGDSDDTIEIMTRVD